MDNFESLSTIYPNVLERTKKTSEMWKELSEHEKSRYKEEYEKDKNEFFENLTEEDKEAIQTRKESLSSQREKRNIRKYGKEAWREKPKVGPVNSYIEYIREQTPSVPKGENHFVYLSKTWKELSEYEKEKYKEMALQTAEEERRKLSEWEEKNTAV